MRATMTEAVIFELLRRVPLFADLPPADLQAVARAARALSKKKAARIFEEGSPADSCYVITAGRAKVVLSGPDGTEVTLGMIEPFELVGEIALLDNATRSASFVAVKDCHLIRISSASFNALRGNRAFNEKLVVHVTSMLRRATEQLRAIYTYSSSERVSWCLARLAHRTGRRVGTTISISPRPLHHELADMIGCTRETVSRALGELTDKKWISGDARHLKLDEAAFSRYLEAERAIADVGEVTRVV